MDNLDVISRLQEVENSLDSLAIVVSVTRQLAIQKEEQYGAQLASSLKSLTEDRDHFQSRATANGNRYLDENARACALDRSRSNWKTLSLLIGLVWAATVAMWVLFASM